MARLVRGDWQGKGDVSPPALAGGGVTMWKHLNTCAADLAALLLGGACAGQAEVPTQAPSAPPVPVARFVGISDAVPSNYFDARTTAPDPLDPDSLVIGFEKGSDPATLV